MPTDHSEDRFGERWPGVGPHGRLSLPRVSRRALAVGGGAALAIGLALGLWARPELGASGDTDAAEHLAAAVPIEVDRPAPPARTPTAGGKLEVLPPDMAAASRPTAPVPQADPSVATFDLPPPPPAPAPPAVIRASPTPLASPMASPAVAGGPPPSGRSAAACGGAGLADQMVCDDPDLAAADREMRGAYRRALRSGASPGALRADQQDWMSIREDAARHSRRALAEVYAQRIDELNAAAADRDGVQEDPGDAGW